MAPTTTTVYVAPPGKWTFSVQNVAVGAGEWLTIAVHPTEVPIGIVASSTAALDVCPADLDGSRLLPWFFSAFQSCLPLDAMGRVVLPSANSHASHVAFALRARQAATITKVTVNYTNSDAFVQVVPPPGRGDGMVVSFTPLSATVGAQAYSLPDFIPAVPGVQVALDQQGQTLTMTGPCSFPSELTSCFRGVQPNRTVAVNARGNPPSGQSWALYLNWLP